MVVISRGGVLRGRPLSGALDFLTDASVRQHVEEMNKAVDNVRIKDIEMHATRHTSTADI